MDDNFKKLKYEIKQSRNEYTRSNQEVRDKIVQFRNDIRTKC